MRHIISKLLSVSAIPVALLALSGCSADEIETPNSGKCNTVIEVTTIAPEGIGATGSRTAVDPTEYTSGQIGVNWLPNDKIGVYGDKGSGNVGFDNQSKYETDRTSFAGNLKDGETPLYAYYPYNPSANNDPASLTGTLPLTQHYSTATRELEGDWKVGTPKSGSSAQFTFRHIFPFLKFDVNAAGTDIVGEKLLNVSLTVEGARLGGDFRYDLAKDACTLAETAGADCVTMEWSDTPALTTKTFHGYMNVAPCGGLLGKNIDIVITTDRHIIRFSQECKLDAFEAGYYYTIPLELSRFAGIWTIEDNPDGREENAAWVPGLESRLACANTVFAVPGQPFMHKIRVPQSTSQSAHAVVPVKTGIKRAYNLPEGLEWDAERCLVRGTAPAAGEYTYSVEFEVGGVTYSEGIRLTVSDNLHQPTPHMGWQSWNVLETKIDQASILSVADALVANGWADAGYTCLGIDDCWQMTDGSRDANKVPNVNTTKFPNGLKYVTDYIHSKGLKAGIYSDAGYLTCASGSQGGGTLLGAYGYESQIAAAFTEWGFDKLKEDWFWVGHGDTGDLGTLDPASTPLARELYARMGDGFKGAGGKVMLSMCEWGIHDPWKWGAEAGASSWRMSYDHRDGWMGQYGTTGTFIKKPAPNTNSVNSDGAGIGLKNTIDLMRNLWPYVGINRYNDADMLVVGIRGGGTSSNDLLYSEKGTMGDAEYETEFAMWCMYGSPLLLTLDVRSTSINAHDATLLKNEELIAINQDPMGQGAEWVKTDGNLDYYMKDLADGGVAIAVVNLGDSQGSYTVKAADFEALDPAATYKVRNLLARSDAGTLTGASSLTGTLAAHATYIIRLTKQ